LCKTGDEGQAAKMKLYDMKQAPNARRVRMFLAEKGIDIVREEIDLVAAANLTPAYLAINPRGLVPTLRFDDGSILDESIAICRYFELEQPEPNLMGRESLEQAQIESWQRRMEFDGLLAIGLAFRNSVPHFSSRPTPGAVPGAPQIPDLVPRGRVLTQHFLNQLDQRLKTSAYVAGERFTIADITAFICIGFAKWIGVQPEPGQSALQRWHDHIKQRPSAKA
jgi:glutathione S-transferase